MELKKLKYRELDRLYVVIYTIKTPIQLEVEGRVRTRNLYTFIGITIEGRRRFLTYGIDVNYDTDFWMQQFKNITRRGTEKVLYITLGEEKGKRAAQLSFQGVKVMPDLFKLIDKTFPYFADTYKNKMPEEIKRLYILETKEEYKKELEAFMYKYTDKEIVKILLENELKDIEKVYEIPHNIRRVIYAFYYIRDYKKQVKKEMNQVKIIEDKDLFMERLEEEIEKMEKAMYLNKVDWMKVLNELLKEEKEVVKYL